MKELINYLKLLLMIAVSSIIQICQVSAQTDIPAGDVSGIWTLVNSPYQINGEIIIPNDSTLAIEPGVHVIFTGYYKFSVQGRLLAIGTQQDTITFTAQDTVTGWHGLRFIHTPATNDTSKIIFCRLQYGLTTMALDSFGGAIKVNGFDKLLISNCLITHNRTSGFYSGGAGIGIISCSPVIENNTICYNNAGDGHGGGILVFKNSSPTIRNNKIYRNQAFGGGAIGYSSGPGGVGGLPLILNNTITENTATDHGGATCTIMCSPLMINTIFYRNHSSIGTEFHFQGGAQGDFYYCDIEGGRSAFARDFANGGSFSGNYENNFNADPLFLDVANDDYHLSDESPCISRGVDSVEVNETWYHAPILDMEGNPRPNPSGTAPDIGALENPTGHEYVPYGIIEQTSIYDEIILDQNHPNPCNSATEISFSLPYQQEVTLRVFDIHGREIAVLADKIQSPGKHTVVFHTGELSAGTYFYQLITGDSLQIRKCMVVR